MHRRTFFKLLGLVAAETIAQRVEASPFARVSSPPPAIDHRRAGAVLARPAVHAQRIERWLGREALGQVLDATKDFYWPIPVAHVPGAVYSYRGDLFGQFQEGGVASLVDYGVDVRRAQESLLWTRPSMRPYLPHRMGFSSLSDLISEATTGGKLQGTAFSKVGSTGVVGATSTLWRVGNIPSGGAAGAALAAGTNCTRATAGALGQANPAGGDTLHLVSFSAINSVATQTLLLWDRIWHGAPSIAVATAQTITMTPSRHATTGASGTSKGNFAHLEITTVLPATAHNWTLQYVDDSGNAAEGAAARAGLSAGIVDRIDDNVAGSWFIPLNSGDLGISNLTQLTLSATLASGALNLVLGSPVGLFPLPGVANLGATFDGINSAFNMVAIETDACLNFWELMKSATTATTYNGYVVLVSG